jgi:hypothetical protein
MMDDLAVGTALAMSTVIIHTIGLATLTAVMGRFIALCDPLRTALGRGVTTVATVLGLFGVHAVEIWLWAVAYFLVGAIPDMPTALYFSVTTFTTLGYGDVVLGQDWRLLGGLEGITGFLLIGWSTAYLVAAAIRYASSHHP